MIWATYPYIEETKFWFSQTGYELSTLSLPYFVFVKLCKRLYFSAMWPQCEEPEWGWRGPPYVGNDQVHGEGDNISQDHRHMLSQHHQMDTSNYNKTKHWVALA